MAIKAEGRGVIITPIEKPEMTSGGIHIPNSNGKSGGMRKGLVVHVGNDVPGLTKNIKPGVEVFHLSSAGTEIVEDGKKFVFLDLKDVKGYYE